MRILLLFCLLINAVFVSADTAKKADLSDPNQVIRSVSINTFARINNDKERLQSEPSYMKVVIEEELIPYFDYKYAAYMVMGSYVQETSRDQRDEFVDAFRTYLVNVYGHILFKYDQQQIEIIDTRHFEEKRIVNVAVRIKDQSGQLTNLEFKLRHNKKTNEWKVFDVIAEGVSMLDTKRSEIGDLINKKGIDQVIQLLLKKNNESYQ